VGYNVQKVLRRRDSKKKQSLASIGLTHISSTSTLSVIGYRIQRHTRRGYMKSLFKFSVIFSLTIAFFSVAQAGDINWSGKYQVEAQLIKNPGLGAPAGANESSFFNHHLVLNPHIIAADGITIHSRFDIFNNSSYANSQFGEFFGGSTDAASPSDATAATGEVPAETIAVTELYLSWTQQFGSLVAGRAPVQFGLGITHNAGNGEFDHWFDRKDLVGYKFVMGNMFFMPMYGKVKEGDAQDDDDIRDYMIHFGYENLDTDLEIGLFYQQRKANPGGNDLAAVTTPTDIFNESATTDGTSSLSVKTYNLFVKKKNGPFHIGIEASMQDGSTGLIIASGEKISLDAYAIAGEIAYKPDGSKWEWDVKLGTISGDDSGTPETYEGYLVDRNYDVAMLLFNYRLGDGSDIIGNEKYINAVTGGNTKVDVGQMSNTVYFAPGFNWKWSDKWGMKGRFTYAQLAEEMYANQDKDLGMELDLSVYYRPFDRFVVQMDTGYLMTGDAFKGPGNLENDNAYGIITKAAISF